MQGLGKVHSCAGLSVELSLPRVYREVLQKSLQTLHNLSNPALLGSTEGGKRPNRTSNAVQCITIRRHLISGPCSCGQRFEDHGAHVGVNGPTSLHCAACCEQPAARKPSTINQSTKGL